MILVLLYYLLIKIIGFTTKLLFKTDSTKYLREEFKKDLCNYFFNDLFFNKIKVTNNSQYLKGRLFYL